MKKIILGVAIAFGLTTTSAVFMETSAQTRTVYKTKKPWSHRKKDAVIGVGAGAVTGALISHNHAKGALIGGVVGGAGGYLLGRHKDKKYGTPSRKYVYRRRD
jgi:hypothetical protein